MSAYLTHVIRQEKPMDAENRGTYGDTVFLARRETLMVDDFAQRDTTSNEPYVQPVDTPERPGRLPGNEVWSPDQAAQSAQGGVLSGPLGAVRQQIENQIGQAIDHYAGHVPGGDKYTPEAKRAVSSILDGLQSQLEREASSRLGNIGGNLFGEQQPQGGNQESRL
jgi:hypothetical protein